MTVGGVEVFGRGVVVVRLGVAAFVAWLVGPVGDGAEGRMARVEFSFGVLAVVKEEFVGL